MVFKLPISVGLLSRSKVVVLSGLLLSISLSTCTPGSAEQKSLESQVVIDPPEDMTAKIEMAKTVVYSLPSPIETSMLLKHADVDYDENILNPASFVNNYNTIKKKALNLGIYCADLSYCSVFDQQQTTINYMMAVKKIAEGLDIANFVDDVTKTRLETNFNDRDSVLAILSEIFMKSNALLLESRSTILTSLVLYGGWVEGLYIATQLAKKSQTINNILIDRISDQGLSLSIVIDLLNENQNNQDVAAVLLDANKLAAFFNNFSELKTNSNNGHEDYYTLLEPELNKLIEETSVIRSKYTR